MRGAEAHSPESSGTAFRGQTKREIMNSYVSKLKWKIKVSAYNQNIAQLMKVVERHLPSLRDARLLDIGCNDGIYTKKYCERFGIEFANAYGVDYNKENIRNLPRERFHFHNMDVLRPLPFADESFDVVVMNQVLEHTKNVAHICCEINRVSKVGAIIAISVPNLAALHNRLLLMCGRIPFAIQGMDAHVRGFTRQALRDYVGNYGFEYLDCVGGGMYPFWGRVSGRLGSLMPQFAVFFTQVLRKSKACSATARRFKEYHDTKLDEFI